MTNDRRSTEWLDLMLGELEQRRREAEEARREAELREAEQSGATDEPAAEDDNAPSAAPRQGK